MILLLVVIFVVLLVCLMASAYLLGFRIGGASTLEELARVRAEAAQASRQLGELTRQAFVAMAEEVERRGHPGHRG